MHRQAVYASSDALHRLGHEVNAQLACLDEGAHQSVHAVAVGEHRREGLPNIDGGGVGEQVVVVALGVDVLVRLARERVHFHVHRHGDGQVHLHAHSHRGEELPLYYEGTAKTIFMSHETYTPARGGSAAAEVMALRETFGQSSGDIIIANTKGFTGHPMGVGVEDVLLKNDPKNRQNVELTLTVSTFVR